jgi:hypothetical protein
MRLLPFLLLASAAAAQPADRTIWKTLKPTGDSAAAKILVSGKALTYYDIGGEGCTVRVTGPTRFRVYIRAHFAKDAPERLEGKLALSLDGTALEGRKLEARRSKSSTYVDGPEGAKPGLRHSHFVDVPEGEHTLVVKSDVPARGSFSVATGKKRSLKTEMTPCEFEKAVEEIYQERERTWYFGTKDRSVCVEVTGPTTLDVTASVNFDSSMRSSVSWQVEVLVDDKVAEKKSFKSDRSHVRSYPDEKSVVPGQQESFQVAVPEGRHRIELRPSGDRTAAFRVLIPTKDLTKAPK